MKYIRLSIDFQYNTRLNIGSTEEEQFYLRTYWQTQVTGDNITGSNNGVIVFLVSK